MEKFIKLITTSLVCVCIIGLCGITYGLFAVRSFTLLYAYNANFVIGAILIASGVFLLFMPTKISFKKDKLVDHSTYIERTSDAREARQGNAYELIFLGIANIIIAGTIQVVLWLILG
jgi:hypothetical protein